MMNINKSDNAVFILKFEEYLKWFLFKYFYSDTADYVVNYSKRRYKNNRLKSFKMIKTYLFIGKDKDNSANREDARKLYKYLDDIRIEYIILSDEISENLIVRPKTSS
ncbi:hypothetical protein KIS1582_4920 [Cytobacillus firmus]|uniref:Uncharacterized protein n=1 Tax=Cytobacillus firmus TaxID=1399 RepID=A0A800N854_CYTFI|nr:hypothetical protein [Cytobacillus firmus]KAF0821378.1 hypothetical protein KIS1582_4920 [Cytobacillus firmus]